MQFSIVTRLACNSILPSYGQFCLKSPKPDTRDDDSGNFQDGDKSLKKYVVLSSKKLYLEIFAILSIKNLHNRVKKKALHLKK